MKRRFKRGKEQSKSLQELVDMNIVLDWFPLVGMSILTVINFYIAYVTYKLLKISIDLLKETVILRKETVLIRQISVRIEEKL